MYLDNSPVLHVIDAGTHFMSARFLASVDTKTVWDTFLYCWALVYTGYPEQILTDQGSAFTSNVWATNCAETSIELLHTSVESHNSLGICEAYHSTIRRIYNKLSISFSDRPKSLRLAMTIKALNDTAGPNGLVPSLLLFGTYPRLPDQQHFDNRARTAMLKSAREEYETIQAKQRVNLALNRNVPAAAQHVYFPNQPVYVFREHPNKRWTGPHVALSQNDKTVLVDIGDSRPRAFNAAQVKPARLPSIDKLIAGYRAFDSHTNSLTPPQDVEQPPATPASVATQDTVPLLRNDGTGRIFLTEIISPRDPRSGQFESAKRKELEGLIKRGTFKLVLREELGRDPNIVPSRFVLAIKHQENGSELLKARLVLGGHRDRDKSRVVHSATTLKQSSVRLLLALAGMLDFDIWSTDITQAYLQSSSNLQREIFVRPDVLELDENQLLQVVKPLYGLSDSGDYWNETLTDHHLQDLSMEKATGDFSLFFCRAMGKLVGLSGTYVDDILRAGDTPFRSESDKHTASSFDAKPPEILPLKFTGLEISRNPAGHSIGQPGYIARLRKLAFNATYDEFRSARARLAWVVHSRPDIACPVSLLAQVTPESFSKLSIVALNKVVHHVQSTRDLRLTFPKLDEATLFMVAYSDASFNNGPGHTSHLGYVVLLMDKYRRRCIIQFSSHKSRRITRSCMAAETLAFVDAFDNALLLKHDLQRILGKELHLLMLTDSQSLFDVVTRSKYPTEKRLQIDLAGIREAYDNREIANIGLIRSDFNVADGLTKVGPNPALLNLMKSDVLNHTAEQI
jgi:hypothetical protein